ncbi:hypothetical protein EKO23_22920 [Nocardioides guangzhouensis]|uniref:GerMN domain-containing protein n=1 Tax=Nocardioides guangzhouensis TaxID=2497878 RepID=A0A4Q4Z2K0_9ACTN|nr:Gmad2 immunoglobulin-like domain-containing protein [Nocardioides guangzhouensis]RYP81877.1 hypothetical protein EKO23_22920 [Nocardioides guangzhouensis]
MSRHDEHEDVRRALHDAVDDVEPRPGIHTIRARTAQPHRDRRPWLLGAFGAAVATAAVVAGVAVLGNDPSPRADRDPAATTSPDTSPTPSTGTAGTGEPAPSPSDGGSDGSSDEVVAAPVYLAGDTPQGVRLYREFRPVAADDRLRAAANLAVRGDPVDPDYRTLWPAGAELSTVSFDGVGSSGLISVTLASPSLRERPAGMSEAQAGLAVQQVVYTLQGVVGARAPVQFRLDGNPVDQVLGVPTSEPITNAPQPEVLAQVNVTEPEQGAEASGRLLVSGVADSFEATVPLQVRRGGVVVLQGFATAQGWGGRLYPWTTTLDISGLPPGDYTLVASTDDPSGGEGGGPQVDTKDFTIPG